MTLTCASTKMDFDPFVRSRAEWVEDVCNQCEANAPFMSPKLLTRTAVHQQREDDHEDHEQHEPRGTGVRSEEPGVAAFGGVVAKADQREDHDSDQHQTGEQVFGEEHDHHWPMIGKKKFSM